MILDEKLLRSLQEKKGLTYNKICQELEKRGFISLPGVDDDAMIIRRHNKRSLSLAKEYLDSVNLKNEIKFSPIQNYYVLTYHLPAELLDECKLMKESLNRSYDVEFFTDENRDEFIDYEVIAEDEQSALNKAANKAAFEANRGDSSLQLIDTYEIYNRGDKDEGFDDVIKRLKLQQLGDQGYYFMVRRINKIQEENLTEEVNMQKIEAEGFSVDIPKDASNVSIFTIPHSYTRDGEEYESNDILVIYKYENKYLWATSTFGTYRDDKEFLRDIYQTGSEAKGAVEAYINDSDIDDFQFDIKEFKVDPEFNNDIIDYNKADADDIEESLKEEIQADVVLCAEGPQGKIKFILHKDGTLDQFLNDVKIMSNKFEISKFNEMVKNLKDSGFKESTNESANKDKEPLKTMEEEFDDLKAASSEIDNEEKSLSEIPSAPQPGPENGLASIINGLIRDEWEAIDGYNSAIATAQEESAFDLINIFKDIVNEENKHVGQLQAAMQTVSPNAVSIDKGADEGKVQLAVEDKPEIQLSDSSIE